MKKAILVLTTLFLGVVFIFLFLEVTLRILGFKPGVVHNEYYPPKEIRYSPHFNVDSFGIQSRDQNNFPVNNEGFWSHFNYDKSAIDSLKKASDQKVVMVVGDSYTEGMNAEPRDSSFINILSGFRNEHFLNFGIAATDLQQYQLVVKRYIDVVRPDLVIINFYFGNDIQRHLRPVYPNIPICYAFEDWVCFYAIPNAELSHHYNVDLFSNPEEAMDFYLSHYTLYGSNADFFERMIRHSIILSKAYLNARFTRFNNKYRYNNEYLDKQDQQLDLNLNNSLVSNIQSSCDEHGVELVFTGIPSPSDVINKVDLRTTYGKHFFGSNLVVPDINQFTINDYDGQEDHNHFENSGQYKYALFLDSLLSDHFK